MVAAQIKPANNFRWKEVTHPPNHCPEVIDHGNYFSRILG
jgi:hypothetical protein